MFTGGFQRSAVGQGWWCRWKNDRFRLAEQVPLRTVDPQFGKFLQQRLGLNTLGDGGQSVFPGDEDDGLHDAFVLAILEHVPNEAEIDFQRVESEIA